MLYPLITRFLPLLFTTGTLATALPSTLHSNVKRVDNYEWAVIGDSWASGVRASDSEDYISGSQVCLLTNYAYGPQLEKDQSWNGGDKENFHFAACSGAVLGDMVRGAQQINETGKPHLIVMTAGGNNAKFFDIATNCIYQQNDGVDYGPEYADDTDGTGLCAKSIKASSDYITGVDGSIGTDLKNTIDDLVLRTTQFNTYDDTLLYITGYAHFFAVDDNWCDSHSFGAFPSRRPKLTLKLRQAINDLTEKLNNVYQQTVTSYPSKQIRYVSITEGFATYRFCESKPAWWPDWVWYNRQYYGSYVRFWNVVLPQIENTDPVSGPPVPNPMVGFNGQLFTWTTDIPGYQQRPFHPKNDGYTAIKDAIIAQMKIDKVPQIDPPTPTSTAPPSPTELRGKRWAAADYLCV
ncbi:hypothetical protein P7C71_g5415, partial [Lecanoromycetidae sp. Uapishka_2]